MRPATDRATHTRVLIVEDDARLSAILTHGLRGRGYAVQAVETVRAARELLDSQPADAIVVDINLPDGSGWDIVRRAKATLPHSPRIVVISASDALRPPDPDAAPDAVLRKPFAIDALIRQVGGAHEARSESAGSAEGRAQ